MIRHLPFLIAGLLFLQLLPCVGQEAMESNRRPSQIKVELPARHHVHAELAGRSLVFGSLNYEYALNHRISIGAGFGFIDSQRGTITQTRNGNLETGKQRTSYTTQMIFGNYFIGKNNHRLYLTGGLTTLLFTDRRKFPSDRTLNVRAYPAWNVGIGYQLTVNKLYFRLTGYCLHIPYEDGYLPHHLPWIGLAFGWKIR